MDDKNDDQIIQEVEMKLKIQQEATASQNTQAEKSRSPYSNEERFKLISPMYDMVVNQMNVISACFSVHSHIAFTEVNEKNLSEDITRIPQQLSDILLESTKIRNNLIEIIGAMEQLSNGIARFVKIANNPKLQGKSLVKFLHFVEAPKKKLRALLDKTCELDAQKIAIFEKSLVTFIKNSGSEAVPKWVKEQAQCKKELEALENERQEKFLEDIVEYDEVNRIIAEMEFYNAQLEGHEHLKTDLQNEKETLQKDRDYLQKQATTIAAKSGIAKMFYLKRDKDLDVLREQKEVIKREISEIKDQESRKILYESGCKEAKKHLSEKLISAKEKVEKAKTNRREKLDKIDKEIKSKKEEVKKFEEQIIKMLKKYGNPSINSTCLLLESIVRLAKQQKQGTGVSKLNHTAMESFLADIEYEIDFIRGTDGSDLLDDEWIMTFEESIAPLNFFVSEIRPIIRNSIHGINPEELAEYSAGKALEPAFKTNLRIEG